MELKLTFDVTHTGEPGAGLTAYSDTVVVALESGEPGGEPGEFEKYMRDCIAEWFDGAKVEERKEGSLGCDFLAGLTPEQQAAVDSAVFLGPTERARMADFFARGVEVVIFKQTECSDSPAYAAAPLEAQDFWLGCWDTHELARAGATALGLRVKD